MWIILQEEKKLDCDVKIVSSVPARNVSRQESHCGARRLDELGKV